MRTEMNIPYSVALKLQLHLRELLEDDSSCISFILGNIDGMPINTNVRWQYGVDMIYRCIKAGLVTVPYFQIDCEDLESFFHALQTLNPFDGSGGMMWSATFLRGTDKLEYLLNRHFSGVPLYDAKLNTDFLKDLEEIFVLHNVPWSETPLLPIAP
jgi:hypothetical protein